MWYLHIAQRTRSRYYRGTTVGAGGGWPSQSSHATVGCTSRPGRSCTTYTTWPVPVGDSARQLGHTAAENLTRSGRGRHRYRIHRWTLAGLARCAQGGRSRPQYHTTTYAQGRTEGGEDGPQPGHRLSCDANADTETDSVTATITVITEQLSPPPALSLPLSSSHQGQAATNMHHRANVDLK